MYSEAQKAQYYISHRQMASRGQNWKQGDAMNKNIMIFYNKNKLKEGMFYLKIFSKNKLNLRGEPRLLLGERSSLYCRISLNVK